MKRDAEKESFWRQAIGEAESSGKTVRGFCQEKGLNENQFYSWRRELKLRDAEGSEQRGFVELVSSAGTNAPAGVSLEVDGRISIVLQRGFDREVLKAALVCLSDVLGPVAGSGARGP
jgi:hypothetical protein